jgi:hypothetical protein
MNDKVIGYTIRSSDNACLFNQQILQDNRVTKTISQDAVTKCLNPDEYPDNYCLKTEDLTLGQVGYGFFLAFNGGSLDYLDGVVYSPQECYNYLKNYNAKGPADPYFEFSYFPRPDGSGNTCSFGKNSMLNKYQFFDWDIGETYCADNTKNPLNLCN